MMKGDPKMARTARSGVHLANHFAEVPLLLIGFGRTKEGSGIYPAIWSAMLAARAEGIGSTLTGFLAELLCERGDGHPGCAEGRRLAHARGRYDGLPNR
jgi:hypothetical protein